MKQLLSVAIMVLVTLVGMVGFSRAGNAVSALQATANPTTGAVIEPPAAVNPVDEYSPYYDPDKRAVIEPPATLNARLPAKRKMYYLTTNYFDGGDAIRACDSGFHMASLWEIQDPSTVQYASGRNPAYDVSYEPPLDQTSDQFRDYTGWVRTDSFALEGIPDYCAFSMSSFEQQSGTTMTRRSLWGENNGHSLYEESDPAAWFQSTRTASFSRPEPVWCVEGPE